jgi:hypothetical protein
MGLLLTISKLYIPANIRKRKLEMLFKATADAFRVAVPSTRGISFNDCLKLYAEFTRKLAIDSIKQNKELEVKSRLFQNAYLIGQQLKRDFKVETPEVMQMGALIYKVLKIDFQGELGGDITIARCFFSTYYSSQVCQLISHLDEGLLAGLAGGGKLKFYQRLTEGHECCRAHLETGTRTR